MTENKLIELTNQRFSTNRTYYQKLRIVKSFPFTSFFSPLLLDFFKNLSISLSFHNPLYFYLYFKYNIFFCYSIIISFSIGIIE